MTFAEKLQRLRGEAGLTQQELAERSGVSLGAIRDYEQGNREPLLSSAQKLAKALRVSLDVFPPAELPPPEKRKPRKRKEKKDGSVIFPEDPPESH
jgi:transcriptional regulator with XRE-family HTH domain